MKMKFLRLIHGQVFNFEVMNFEYVMLYDDLKNVMSWIFIFDPISDFINAPRRFTILTIFI